MLVRPRNPLNIGAVARAMANFGLTDLAVVDPYKDSWRETRSAVHGAHVVRAAKLFESVEEAVADRELVIGTTAQVDRKLDLPGLYLPDLGKRLKQRFPGGPKATAVLFGNERTGLSNEELELCHWIMTLPTHPDTPSMNLGQAAALVCYELSRGRRGARIPLPAKDPARMTAADVDRSAAMVMQVMKAARYLDTWPEATRREMVRRTLLRWDLREDDRFLVNGVLRWVLRALERKAKETHA